MVADRPGDHLGGVNMAVQCDDRSDLGGGAYVGARAKT